MATVLVSKELEADFRDLPVRQSLRFWALHRIGGEDPAREGQSGAAAVAAWQDWGRTQGYLV